MNRLKAVFLLAFLMGLTSCAAPIGQEAAATPSPAIESSPTRIPTATPTPTITPTPTPPFPPLAVDIDHPVVTTDGPEGALYRLGMGWQSEFAVSPDSRLLALAARTGLYVYTANSLEPVWFAPNKPYVSQTVWSPDSSLVVGLHSDKTISVFAADDGSLLHQFPVETNAEYITSSTGIGVSADNRLLFVEKRLYDIASGKELADMDWADVSDYDTHLAFTNDGILRAAYPCDEGGFCLWQSDTEQVTPYPLSGAFEVELLSISPDGSWVLVRADNSIRLFEVETETFHRFAELANIPFDEDSYYGLDITWAPDSSAFTIILGGLAQGYLFQTGTETSLLSWAEGGYIFWSPDSSTVLRTARGTIYFYEAGSGELIRKIEGIEGKSLAPLEGDLTISIDLDDLGSLDLGGLGGIGGWVVALLNDGSILWERSFADSYHSLGISTGDDDEFIHTLNTDVEYDLMSAGWTPDNLLLVASDETALLFFNGATGEHVASVKIDAFMLFPSHYDFQWSADGINLVWLPDGNVYFEDENSDRDVLVWNRATGELSAPFDTGGIKADSLALSPDGRQLLIGSDIKNTIFLFDMETGEKLNQVEEDEYKSNDIDLAWSPDGSQFASLGGGTIDPIIIWDAETFTPLYTLMPDWDDRTTLQTINWVGDLIAATGWNEVFVWEANTQTLLWSDSTDPDASDSHVFCGVAGIDIDNRMDLSADGRYLALAKGGTAQGCDPIAVYDAHTGELLHMYPDSGPGGISRIMWSPDGQYLASVAQGDTIVVWDTSLLPEVELP